MKASQILAPLVAAVWILSSCASGGGGSLGANEGGSQPINDKETKEYKKSLLKCYKTGGTRIVKIEGRLRCF